MANRGSANKIVVFVIGVILILGVGWYIRQKGTVATAGGERISYKEWEKRLKNIYGDMVLERMIEEKIVKRLSKKHKIEVDKKEAENKYRELISQVGSKENFKKMLKESKMTEDDVREQLKLGILLEKLPEKEKLKEDDLKKYYEKNEEKFAEKEKVRVRHILVKTQEDGEKALKALQDGISFIDAAKKFSEDETSRNLGGDLGMLEQGAFQNMPRDIEKELFSLNEGQYSRLIQTNLGWHIFYVDKKVSPKKRSFKEAKKEIEKFATSPGGWIEVIKIREGINKKK